MWCALVVQGARCEFDAEWLGGLRAVIRSEEGRSDAVKYMYGCLAFFL